MSDAADGTQSEIIVNTGYIARTRKRGKRMLEDTGDNETSSSPSASFDEASDAEDARPKRKKRINRGPIVTRVLNLPAHTTASEISTTTPTKMFGNNLLRVLMVYTDEEVERKVNEQRTRDHQRPLNGTTNLKTKYRRFAVARA